jgi:hypothetical protein
VAIDRERVQGIDVTVRHEDIGYLEEGHNSKIKKSTPLLPTIAKQLRQEPGRVLLVVIGTSSFKPSIEKLASKFDGHGPAHGCRLRPIRGPRYEDQAAVPDTHLDTREDESASALVSTI